MSHLYLRAVKTCHRDGIVLVACDKLSNTLYITVDDTKLTFSILHLILILGSHGLLILGHAVVENIRIQIIDIYGLYKSYDIIDLLEAQSVCLRPVLKIIISCFIGTVS